MPDILHTPWWITVVRGFQVLFSLIVFALAATIIHDVYLEELGLCIATGLITWIVTAYLIATEKSKAIQHLYHIIAVLCLEAFMVILWLATFAATAARRAGFVYNVSVDDCYNDGSTINSSHCSYLKRRFLLRRGPVLFKTGQGLMSGAAGLGALVWLLYIVTFVWTVLMFTRGRKEGRFIMSSTSPSQDHQLEEAKTETVHLQQQQQQPPMNQHAQQQQQPPQQYSPGHQTVAAQQHQYPPTPVTQPYAPSPDTHYAGMASTMSPSTPSEVASYNHQSELASHRSQSGQPVQMPTYDEHHYQADYAQHHSAELPAMQATYTPQTGQEYHAPQQ